MQRITRFGFLLAVLGLVSFSLTACSNTFRGMGEDIEEAGETIQDIWD